MNLVSISTIKKKEEIDDYIENFNLNVGEFVFQKGFELILNIFLIL